MVNTNSYAIQQEDLEVLKFFGDRPGVFVEAGANHPVEASQTYLLELRGWRGVLIEPNPELARLCRELRPASQTFDCAVVEPNHPTPVQMRIPSRSNSRNASISAGVENRHDGDEFFECEARTLDSILEDSGLDQIDFFSIDLEGYEAAALRGFAWDRWRPRLISVEDHCEDLDTHRLVSSRGYKLVRRIGDNHWYVPQSSPISLTFQDRLKFLRKLYLSLPLRKLRKLSQQLRGHEEG